MDERKPPSEPRAMREMRPLKTIAGHHQTAYIRSDGAAAGFGQAEDARAGTTHSIEPEKNTAWSSSKVWMSEEEKIRGRFLAMRTNAKHLGMENSPFLPKTPGEYAAVLAEKKATEAHKMAESAQKRREDVKVDDLLRDRKFGDGLSTVLAMNSAFNEIPGYDEDDVDRYWPPAWAYFQKKRPS